MGQGAYILGCSGPRLSQTERRFFAEADPWGFILFARNVETPDQIRRLTDELRDCVGRNAAILIDQEGGRVQRMEPPHWRQHLPPLDQIEMVGPDNAARSMYLRMRLIAAELRAVGIDANCAPCADIATPLTHPFLRNRCYGTEVRTVVAVARAVADGLLAGGVLPVLKHLPGHGRAQVDSHLGLPRVTSDAKTLYDTDFAAFAALNDLPMGMSAHLVYAAFDADNPATTSRRMTNLIRRDIGFGGLLMSDDIMMNALSGTLDRRCRAALDAGCDLILHCSGKISEMERLVTTCGGLACAAQRRADGALTWRRGAEPVDIGAVEAELETLLGVQVNG